MEIMLAIVVVAAVIFFGALISMGNERQRRAIDNLREQIVLWAMQDLKIKRDHLVRTVQVTDPLGWLNGIVSKACGVNLNLQILESFEEPKALICVSGDNTRKIILSPNSPSEIHRIRNGKRSRLKQIGDNNPLLSLPRGVKVHELSVLNSDFLFDLELAMVWEELTGQAIELSEYLWVYESL